MCVRESVCVKNRDREEEGENGGGGGGGMNCEPGIDIYTLICIK